MSYESCIKYITKVFANYSRKAFLNNNYYILEMTNDYLSILACKVNMCDLDGTEEGYEDDSNTNEYLTMSKTLIKVLNLIRKAKNNNIDIKDYTDTTLYEKEVNEATEYLIDYISKEITNINTQNDLKNECEDDIRITFINIVYDYFTNNEQGQKLFKIYKLITKAKDIKDDTKQLYKLNQEIKNLLI